MSIRGLKAALNSSGRYAYKRPESAVDYLVVGGGVVGLAIAQRLSQKFPSKTTFLVERHASVGQETSARNSEVIHAGFYYPVNSLKTRFCLRGRHLMYERCAAYNIPHRKLGKLAVALQHQLPYINELHDKARKLQWPPHSPPDASNHPVVPTRLISGDEARELEPHISPNIAGALLSPETGIIDSHSFMESLEKDILESEGGELAYSTQVVRVDPHAGSQQAHGYPSLDIADSGWVVQSVTGSAEETDSILARTLINASGLSGNLILNSLLPDEHRIPMYYAKGSYASYHGPGISGISHLLYPCPGIGRTVHGFQSLGTHLTLDLDGKVKFGPDLEWLDPPDGSDPDFWLHHLVPGDTRLKLMHEAITEYLPGVSLDGLQPDYCGIRPKLVGPNGGFQDFVFRKDYSESFGTSVGTINQRRGPMITLLGIESPGLTSSLAIAEFIVEDVLCGEEGQGSGKE